MTLKEYEVTVEGRHPHKTTLMLSEEDARRMGVFKDAPKRKAAPKQKAAKQPANKARTADTKTASAPTPTAEPTKTPPAGVEAASDPSASE